MANANLTSAMFVFVYHRVQANLRLIRNLRHKATTSDYIQALLTGGENFLSFMYGTTLAPKHALIGFFFKISYGLE